MLTWFYEIRAVSARVWRAWMLATLASLSAAAGVASSAVADEPKLAVVATTGMIADAARAIGGDQVTVKALMGPGVDPHAYRQTRTDVVALAKADLVLWHGLYLEAQMDDFMHNLAKRRTVIAVAEALPKDLLRSHDVYKDKYDPHVWMDPRLWLKVIAAVRDGLVQVRPQAKQRFEEAAARYSGEIETVADYSARVLDTVPKPARMLLTAHDAFGYFGRAYSFQVVGIQGISTESEAGLKRVAALVDMLVENRIGAVFVESSVSDRNVRALIEGAGARGHTVRIGGELFSDAMGLDGTYQGTYVGMIDHNVTTIARALGGTAPASGMQGRLAARD